MAESPSSASSSSPMGSVKKLIIGAGVLGGLGAVAALLLINSKKQTRNLTPDIEIIDKL